MAFELKLTSETAFKTADAARHFRNLIHPGRAQRTGERATAGRAYSALGAVRIIAEELTEAVRKGTIRP